jgi:group I intron endonuclease
MILGKIYKIVNSVDNLIYIGSTKTTLSRRMTEHRSRGKKHQALKLYTHFALHGIENFRIVLIENYEYDTKDQLRAREDYHIQLNNTIKNGLNGIGALRTVEQRRQYDRVRGQTDKRKQTKKQYNKEYQNEYKKIIHTCECGKSGLFTNKSKHIKTKQHNQFQLLADFITN